MKALDLPVLPIETPLKEAFDTMKSSNRSAVLAVDHEGCWLFKAGWIIVGISHRKQGLLDLQNRQPVHLPSNVEMDAIHWQTDLEASQNKIKTLLYRAGTSHMVPTPLPSVGELATLIMIREPLADEIGLGPPDCYCTLPPKGHDPHDYARDQLPADGKCFRDGSRIFCYP